MSLFLASIGFGLVASAVLAIAAVGFTMQFAVTDVLNLAFGSVMIDAAFVAYAINKAGVSVWIGVIGGVVAGAVLSLLLNRVIYTPFQRRGTSPIAIVIVSLGMALILEFSLQGIVGGTNVSYVMNNGSTYNILGLLLSTIQFIVMGLAVLVMIGVHLLLRYSRLGKAMRATSANRSLARNCGIRTDRVVTLTWLITGALAGLAGSMFAINAGTFGATSTELFLVLILAAVFLGGPGQPYGAMIGALVIGLGTEVSAAFISPDYKDVVAFVILLAMLAFRPDGLLSIAKSGS
jgi:branched-chain amino acid transport system permease protein/neutral amino acid transport system permease protein